MKQGHRKPLAVDSRRSSSSDLVQCNCCSRRMLMHGQQNSHHVCGEVGGGLAHSIRKTSSARRGLKQSITFYIENKQLTSRGYLVFMFRIGFCCCTKRVISACLITNKRLLTTLFMTCFMMGANWWVLHHLVLIWHSLFNAFLRQVTTPVTNPVILRALSEDQTQAAYYHVYLQFCAMWEKGLEILGQGWVSDEWHSLQRSNIPKKLTDGVL